MEVAAKLRNASISPQKARLVADMIRRKGVEEAISTLSFTQKKAATMIKKVVESAVANAEHNFGADIDDLVISRIFVDQAASYKRIQPRAKGRANRIVKRNSHITVIVSDQEELS